MKQEELLRHMADNLEVGNPAGHGLLYKGMVSRTKRPENISIHAPQYYELAPKTVVINGIEVDRGVDFEPKKGQEYFEPVINNDELHASYAWNADESGAYQKGWSSSKKRKQ